MKTKQERIIEKQAELIKFLDYPQYHEVREAVNRLKSELASIEAEPESKDELREELLDKINCLVGYLKRWRDNPSSMPPFELKDVIDEAVEYLKTR